MIFSSNDIANLDEDAIVGVVSEEIKKRNWGATQQYLDVLSVVYEGGRPAIAGIYVPEGREYLIAFVPVEGESFFFACYLDPELPHDIRGIRIEAGYRVYFYADSDTLLLEDLLGKITIAPTESWRKGERRAWKNGQLRPPHKTTGIIWEPVGELWVPAEAKLSRILAELRAKSFNLRTLTPHVDAIIQVVVHDYYGNSNINGIALDVNLIELLAATGLPIDYDLYIDGAPIQ